MSKVYTYLSVACAILIFISFFVKPVSRQLTCDWLILSNIYWIMAKLAK